MSEFSSQLQALTNKIKFSFFQNRHFCELKVLQNRSLELHANHTLQFQSLQETLSGIKINLEIMKRRPEQYTFMTDELQSIERRFGQMSSSHHGLLKRCMTSSRRYSSKIATPSSAFSLTV